jgi:hypothetical protein
MRCVPEAVNVLFPELDLTEFKARPSGYALGDIQRMLPPEFTLWPIYVNHAEKLRNANLIKVIPFTENRIPLFLLSKTHCVCGFWSRSEIQIIDGGKSTYYDAEEYFNRHKIYQASAVTDFETYNLLTLKRVFG